LGVSETKDRFGTVQKTVHRSPKNNGNMEPTDQTESKKDKISEVVWYLGPMV